MKNKKFMGSTIGLNASIGNHAPAMTRIEFYDCGETVLCMPVSGHNLATKPGSVSVTRDVFSTLPRDPYDDVVFARTMFALCGYEI